MWKRLVVAAAIAAAVGCDSGNGPVKPQDDPRVLREAEEHAKKAASQEGGNQPSKAAKKK